jgi:hypothetical protein
MIWLLLIHRIPPEPGYLRVGVDPDVFLPAAGEVRFDRYEAAFTHQRDRCTFEVLCALVAPDDGALRAVVGIVHDVDLADGKFGRVEAAGIERLVAGIQGRGARRACGGGVQGALSIVWWGCRMKSPRSVGHPLQSKPRVRDPRRALDPANSRHGAPRPGRGRLS